MTLLLLSTWMFINLTVPWLARDLSNLHVAGFPLGYWLAAEGMLLVYLVLIVVYVIAMERAESLYVQQLRVAAEAPVEASRAESAVHAASP